jgi:superfamily II DNA or RNA helicase
LSPATWRFAGEWRHYQRLCLDAFEADRATGERKTLLVAPPGSGKTLIGLEIVRRIGRPAVVLCPTQTIQRQWRERQAMFGGASDDVHLLTYQSLCRADDPDGMLRAAAERHWAAERAAATGQAVDAVEAEVAGWTGAARAAREREVRALVARLKRRAADGHVPELPAEELLSDAARERLAALRAAGAGVVVLDECHHLVSLWGALLRPVLDALEPEHVLGLTATSPQDLTAAEAALYRELLDREDFFIPTPAVVREGHLAPYQELVQLCTPLRSEREWLDERHARFEQALADLDVVAPGQEHLSLSVWLLARLRERRTEAGAQLSWAELARRRPQLAESGLRWLHRVGEPPPPGAPRGERFRAEPTIDDWVVLLEDYALRCLRAAGDAEAARRLDALRVALADLGFTLTRQGVRRGGGEVDRVLLASAAKPLAMCDALAAELERRGERLRAVVFCDSERPPRMPEGSPLALTGGGRGLLAAAGADDRLWGVRPALVTAESLAVLPRDAEWWLDRLAEELGPGGSVGPSGDLSHPAPAWGSRWWTGWATRLLSAGGTRLLVGTRGLLGEGWDCPQLNVLVDMTAVAADVSVRQMRGRSLRLDPRDPGKLANNWDVVCVAPDLGRGHADYLRFVRRHAHLHAPCEDGTIESGPSHVHPELSPYGPPGDERFVAINLEQRDRAQDLDAARERWQVGVPYRGVDLDALVVRDPPRRTAGSVGLAAVEPPARFWPLPLLLRRRLHPPELPLEWAAGAVCDAYVALGELRPEEARTLRFTVRPEGWVRVSLPDAGPRTSALVCAALDELSGGTSLPRYVVSRRVRGGGLLLDTVWHPVPADLARRRDRAGAFHAAWRRWCGRSELVYAHAGPRGAELAALAAATGGLETQRRRIWR